MSTYREGLNLVYCYRLRMDDEEPYWQSKCSCGWRGEQRFGDSYVVVRDLATCHAIETGHAPVWEPLR